MTDAEAVKIINAYGKALTERKTPFGDLSALPYPKDRIKDAILHGIRQTDDAVFREQLKGAYITLADWQVGFGTRGASAALSEEELKDPMKAMARVSSPDFLSVPNEVAAEAEMLRVELAALGLS